MIISVFDRIENIVGKGENAGYHFVAMFSNTLSSMVVRSWDCVVKIETFCYFRYS